MPFPALNEYLARLADPARPASSVWLDPRGQVHGRFFNCTITSAFQPIRRLDDDTVVAYEGLAGSASASDLGLSLWKLLDHAASDDESVELDRLCRMLHAINFFRQSNAGAADLYLNVHDRLLSAVGSNHGMAFRRILAVLGVPIERIVLQLPNTSGAQRWVLAYVADNYRRNGFRLALNVASPEHGLALLHQIRPAVIKLDARDTGSGAALATLLSAARDAGVAVVVKRLQSAATRELLRQASATAGAPLLAQGDLLGVPQPALLREDASFTLAQPVNEDQAQARYEDGVLHLTLPKKPGGGGKQLSIQ